MSSSHVTAFNVLICFTFNLKRVTPFTPGLQYVVCGACTRYSMQMHAQRFT